MRPRAIILSLALGIAGAMALVPPWHVKSHWVHRTQSVEYTWVFTPPLSEWRESGDFAEVMAAGFFDVGPAWELLAAQYTLLLVAAGLALRWAKPSRKARSVQTDGDVGGQERAIPPRPRLSWILTGMMALVALLVLDVSSFVTAGDEWGFSWYGVYAVFLAFGVWRVRPEPGRERLFSWAMVPVTIQVGTYLATWALIAVQVRVHGWPTSHHDPLIPVLVPASLFGLLLVPLGIFFPFLLVNFSRRLACLLLVEVLGPLLVFGIQGHASFPIGPRVLDLLVRLST